MPAHPERLERQVSLMRYALLGAFVATMAVGQPSAVLDDLEQRALQALTRIPRAESWPAAQRGRSALQRQLMDVIGFDSIPADIGMSALVYVPKKTFDRVPGVIILRTHSDINDTALGLLATALAQLEMIVVEIDVRADHSTLNPLGEGVTPQGRIQRKVRSALAYLKANMAVDPTRLGLVGEGLAGTIAAGINPEVSVAVALDGAPDFASLLKELRLLRSDQLPDPCLLLPGILPHAASHEILSLIAPRPLLLVNAADSPLRYATDLYRMAGEGANLNSIADSGWTSSARFIASTWLARHLQHRSDFTDFHPPMKADEPSLLRLTSVGLAARLTHRVEVAEPALSGLLGAALPEGRSTYSLNCHIGPSVYKLGNDMVHMYPQAGINIPVTVIRPGPTGCDPSRGTLIAVNDGGRSELVNDEIVQEASRRGWVVWMLDPRYIGEMAVPPGPFASATSLLLGEHIPWRQAHDIIHILRRVGDRRYPNAIYARGAVMGLAASYVAAIADARELQWTVLRDAVSSFREMTNSPLALPRFGVLKSFDVPDLWNASRGRVHLISSPEDFVRREW
jgi:hypothetical protein